MDFISMKKFTAKELQDFFLFKRYSKNTQEVIKMVFLKHEKQVDIAASMNMKPQRIHNIKKQFLEDYFEDSKNNNFIKFEGYIAKENMSDLKEFAKKCKSFTLIEKTNDI